MMMTVAHGRLGRALSLSLSRLQDTNVISVGGAHGALGHQNILLVNKVWNQNAPKQ